MKKHLLALCLALAALPATSAPRDRVIFDSDSAYFMDDGAALAMVLADKDVQLLGVTSVIGNFHVKDGVEYLFTVLKAAGRTDVPVHAGLDRPLVNTKERMDKFAKQWGGVGRVGGAYREEEPKEPFGGRSGLSVQKQGAVDFIIQSVNAHPGEVTFLALGPLTNLATALKKAPGIATKLKRVVIMGGNAIFTGAWDGCKGRADKKAPCGRISGNASALAEFNFWFDPEAAHVVLRSEIPRKVLFGLDVTNQARINKKQYDAIVAAKTPLTRIFEWHLGWNHRQAFQKTQDLTIERPVWDTLPAAYLLDPGFVMDAEEMYADVITQYGPAYGALYAHRPGYGDPAPGVKKVTVVKEIDFNRWWKTFWLALTRPIGK